MQNNLVAQGIKNKNLEKASKYDQEIQESHTAD